MTFWAVYFDHRVPVWMGRGDSLGDAVGEALEELYRRYPGDEYDGPAAKTRQNLLGRMNYMPPQWYRNQWPAHDWPEQD